MKLSVFYKDKMDAQRLALLDKTYASFFKAMIAQTQTGQWTKAQQRRQFVNIVPILALYKTFRQLGFSSDEAQDLARQWITRRAKKMNAFLRFFSLFPNFSKTFRTFFRKAMSGTEIWISDFLSDTDSELKVNITKCLWKDTCDFFGCSEVCGVFCSADWTVFGNLKKLQLFRTETLGTAGSKCDFIFRFNSRIKTI